MRKVPIIVGAVLYSASLMFAATSVTHYGITWTFSSDHTTGTFANGEPWVVGPVTITNIDPNPSQSTTGVQHGSMINPVPSANHGFDNNINNIEPSVHYESAKNVALSFPFSLQPGDVLVSSKSSGTGYPNFLKTVSALTVLSSTPPSGSFRPGIWGGDRTVKWNISQLNWSVLKKYAIVSQTPTKAAIEAKVPALPWFEWSGAWIGNVYQPTDNTADGNCQYGRETAKKFGFVGLWLNTNQPLADKQAIAIQMVQNGIDIFEYVQHGGGYYHDGGHKCGRKLPLVLAAMMLNDSELKTMAGNPDLFQEDQQVWFVNQNDVGRALDPWPGHTITPYSQVDVGMAEWGIRHRWEPNQDNRDWLAAYRTVVGEGMRGAWLAAFLLGAQQVWNWPAAFAYMDRYFAVEGMGQDFVAFMWSRYRNVAIQTPTLDGAAHKLAVRVGPNPMRNLVTFTLPEQSGAMAQVEISDRDGRLIVRRHGSLRDGMVLDLSGRFVVPGVYYYTVTSEGKQASGRLMVLPQD